MVFYGQVTPASPAPDLTTVSFTLTGNSETLTTATPARLVTIGGTSWYIVSIPLETRTVQGGPPLTASPGTLALTPADTTYTVAAKVGTATATLPTGMGTLVYGTQSLGLIQRIDLSLGETYAQWSQRIFGTQVDPNADADADGDGISNYNEYLAGTDPKNPNSHFTVTHFTPLPGGGPTLTWDSVQGRIYRVERSTSLTSCQWSTQQDNVQGDGAAKTFTGTNPGTAAHLFYRIGVTPTN